MNESTRLKFYSSFVHPVLTIYIPFMFFTTLLLVFVNSIVLPTGTVVFPPMFFVLMLLVGMSETITGNMLYKERIASILPRLREFVFVIAIGMFLILLFHGDVARKDFSIGRVKIWLPTLILGAQWFLSYFIHQRLREREIFLRFFEGKSPKDTREVYNSYMHEGSESLKAIASVKRLVIALTVLGFVGFVLTSWILRIQYTGFARLIVLIFYISFALIVATMNIWHEAQFIMMDGHIVPRNQRRSRLIVAVLLLLVVLMVVIPFTGSDSVLPENYLARFFAWLENLGTFQPPPRNAEQPEFNLENQDMQIENYMGAVEAGDSKSVDLSAITKIIGWAILVALIVGASIFLLLPLFRGARGGFSPSAGLKKIAEGFKNAFNSFMASVNNILAELGNRRKSRGWDKLRSQNRSARREAAERRATRTALRRRERKVSGRMLRAFFRFTKWGEKRGIGFSFSTGPLEYAKKVASSAPELSDDCHEIADIFEEAVYSNHDLEDGRRSVFLTKVRTITKTR